MYKILKKYGLIRILTVEETFFFSDNSLPIKVKVSNDLVKFNYIKHSPYKNSNFVTLHNKSQIMIWFYENDYSEKIIIPESYLLFLNLKNQEDKIYIFSTENGTRILVKKDGILQSVLSCKNDNRDFLVELIKEEYSIEKNQFFSNEEYINFINLSLEKLTIIDFLKWSQYKLAYKKESLNIFENVAYPIIFLILFSIILNYGHIYYLTQKIEILKNEYLTIKKDTENLKKDIKNSNQVMQDLKNFSENELLYPNLEKSMFYLYSIFDENENTIIKNVSITPDIIKIRIETDLAPIEYINKLNEIKIFKDIILENTGKNNTNNLNVANYKISIKPLKEI